MNADWISLSQYTGGTGSTPVEVNVTDNTSLGVTRYATIRFTNEANLTADLHITQTASTEGLSFNVSPYLLQFATSGETLTGTVISNSKWFVVEYPDWLTVSSDNPQMVGAGNLFFTADQNNGETERSGNIKIVSYGEERLIYAIQPSYSSLKVEPLDIRLADVTEETASTYVTVTASTNWSIIDYEEEFLEFNVMSGGSGTTRVDITVKNIPQYIRTFHLPWSKTVTFSDNSTTKVVTITLVSSDNIDDNAVTVTYSIPAAGTYWLYKYNKCNGCPAWSYELQDDYSIYVKEETKVEQIGYDSSCLQMAYVYFYFSTPGLHTVKYRSNLYSTPYAVFEGNPYISSVVFGDKNNGAIGEYTFWNTSLSKVVLGTGRHTLHRYSFGHMYIGNNFYLPESCTLDADFGNIFHYFSGDTFFYSGTEALWPTGGSYTGSGVGRAGGGSSCDRWFVWSDLSGSYSYTGVSAGLHLQLQRLIIEKDVESIGSFTAARVSTFSCSKVVNKESKYYVVFNTSTERCIIKEIIFIGKNAPSCLQNGTGATSTIKYYGSDRRQQTSTNSIAVYPMDIYYPEDGTGYSEKWNKSYVTLHTYTNIDDIITAV